MDQTKIIWWIFKQDIDGLVVLFYVTAPLIGTLFWMRFHKSKPSLFYLITGLWFWVFELGLDFASWKFKFYTYHGYITMENGFRSLLYSVGTLLCFIGLVFGLSILFRGFKEKIKPSVVNVLSCLLTCSFIVYSILKVSMNLNTRVQ